MRALPGRALTVCMCRLLRIGGCERRRPPPGIPSASSSRPASPSSRRAHGSRGERRPGKDGVVWRARRHSRGSGNTLVVAAGVFAWRGAVSAAVRYDRDPRQGPPCRALPAGERPVRRGRAGKANTAQGRAEGGAGPPSLGVRPDHHSSTEQMHPESGRWASQRIIAST